MSGDAWHVQGSPEVASLVRAAGLVVEHAGVRTALIGGLAVSCRLGMAHRVTGDVDVVAEEPAILTAGSAADNLVASGIAHRQEGEAAHRVIVDGTRVEIIETATLDPADVAGIESEKARLFVQSHRWALESATPLAVHVVGSDVEIEVPVASSAALVAMKLHAFQDRNDDRKRASDAWDLFRLIDLTCDDPAFSREFSRAPEGLLELVQRAVERVFRDDAARTHRWIRAYGAAEWADRATEEALADAADLFRATLA